MAKKNLGGLDAMLGSQDTGTTATAEKKIGRPKTNFTADLLPEDEDRASIIVKTETWARFKALGYWERLKQKTLLDTVLTEYLDRWEKKNGKIKAIPENADI